MFDFNLLANLTPESVLVYLRKSRADDPLLTVEEVLSKHETILKEWIKRNLGREIPQENWFKEVVSGETIYERTEFQKILRLIESPKIKAVLVVELQRLGRPDLEEIGKITKLFRYTNTLVITPHKTYNICDEYDRDMFERELKRGNEYLEYQKKIMSRGRLLSVSQGNFIGNTAPYGYTKTVIQDGKRKCHTLAINEREADVVRMIFDMYVNQGMGRKVISNRLDELHIKPPKGEHWSSHSIREMLENVHYIGKVRWNRRQTVTSVEDGEIIQTRPKRKYGDYLVFDGKHPAIISEDMFERSLAKSGKNHRAKATTKIRNPLAGLLWCQCGRAMIYRTYPSPDGSADKSSPRLMCGGQTYCHTGSCTYDELIVILSNVLRQNIEEYKIEAQANNEDAIKYHTQIVNTLKQRLADLETKELLQWEAQSDPDPAKRMPQHIFQVLNDKLIKEKQEVSKALAEARASMPNLEKTLQKIITLQDALYALESEDMTPEEKNKFLCACIERINYSRETPQRITQPAKRYDPNRKPMSAGGHWTNPDIKLNVTLKI